MGNELQRAHLGLWESLKLRKTDKVNAANRGIVEYNPCNVAAFFEPSRGVYNTVVSGGDYRIRANAILAQTACSVDNSFPVIIVHEGNYYLEQLLTQEFSQSSRYIKVSPNSPGFEPFYHLNQMEIANQIVETAPKDYDIKHSARYYIEAICEVLKANKKKPSFKMLASCPHAQMFDRVDELSRRQLISDTIERELKSKIMMGQSENYKIEAFLSNLRMEMTPIMYKSGCGNKPVNIISSIDNDAILSIDVASVTNKLLIETLVYQLKLALTKGMQYVVIFDSIPLDASEAYSSFIKTKSEKIAKMIVSEDVYAMVGGDEKVFSIIAGDCGNLIVMGHNSGHSALKWAEVFGQYDQYDESYSNSIGSSRRSTFSVFSSPNYQRSVSISKSKEYIIKPEQILRMAPTEAYILSSSRGELAHLLLKF